MVSTLLKSEPNNDLYLGFDLHDLEFTDGSLINEAAAWSNTKSGNDYSICNNVYYLGGSPPTVSGQVLFRQYDNVPPHNRIYYSVNFVILGLGSWHPITD